MMSDFIKRIPTFILQGFFITKNYSYLNNLGVNSLRALRQVSHS